MVLNRASRNAPQAAISLRSPDRFARVIALRTNDRYREARGYAQLAAVDQIQRYANEPGSLVLRYYEESQALQPWPRAGALPEPAPAGTILPVRAC